ncbi:MAG: peptidoglycan DD-metalloendopeptidase family protein [Acidobacteria bacterium]|nr:peptidoglycan DD-metalloendopeptidase family protein [Acidobacteriota bacterium]
MKRPIRPLAYTLPALLILVALSLPALIRTALAADPITLQQPAAVVQPGDVLTLTGKQRFNDGQFRNQLFYVGPEQVRAQRVDASAVSLAVPQLAPGTYAVRVVKQAGNSPAQTLFSQDVEVGGGDQVIAAAGGVVSPGGGRVELPGVARIELTEDISRPSTKFTVEHVSSPVYAQYFLEYMRQGVSMAGEDLPQVAAENFVRIRADQPVSGDMGLKMRVPAEVLARLTPEFEPEMYAEFVNVGADDEEFVEMVPLHAEFDPATGDVSAPLPAQFFSAVPQPAAPQQPGFAAAAAPPLAVEAIIRVAVRRYNAERDLTVKGTITTPATETFEAGARETINLAGTFNTVVPRVLKNPTVYEPFVVRSPKSATHGGVDLRSADGDAISACADGVVTAAQLDPYRRLPNGQLKLNRFGQPQSGGFYVRIRHDDGNSTAYLHLIQNSNLVNVGARVSTGQQIARADSTGGVTGPHLHLNYTLNGTKVDAVPYLRVGEPDDYLRQVSIVATVNGTPVRATQQRITQTRDFEYRAPLDLSLLDLQPNKTYPMTISLMNTTDNTYVPLQRFNLKVKPAGLRVVLTWDKADTDVDLHVQDSKGQHAWYVDYNGIPNGALDHDDTDGFGPEVFTLSQMEAGVTYDVYIHYYSDHGNGDTNAKVVVYVDSEPVTEFTALLPGADRSYHVVGTYPEQPEPTPTPAGPQQPGFAAASAPAPARGQTVPLRYISPDVVEYTLPSQPGVKLYLHLAPKGVQK